VKRGNYSPCHCEEAFCAVLNEAEASNLHTANLEIASPLRGSQ